MTDSNMERVVRTCLQHHVPLIKDTLTCPKGNHQVRRWGTVEASRFTSSKPRFLGAADIDEKELVGAGAPLKEVRVEEKKPGVYDRAKYQDQAGNVLWLFLRKKKLKTPGAHPWAVMWRIDLSNGKKTAGTAAVAPTEDLARNAFASRKKAAYPQGWDEAYAGAGRGAVLTDVPPPPKPVKR